MSKIYEYATKSWPVVKGCDESLPCAERCWAKRECHRLAGNPNAKIWDFHVGLTDETGRWTGLVKLNEAHLMDPLKWREPQRIAVAYHGDLCLAPDDGIDRVFAVMALCPQHAFQVLTKRPEWMQEYITSASSRVLGPLMALARNGGIAPHRIFQGIDRHRHDGLPWAWPLPNVWLGVSVEDREHKSRIDLLRKIPAAVRFLSLEPLLEDFGELDLTGINWVIVGGESGPGARDCDAAWIRSIVAQCKAAGVAMFVKQLGSCPISISDHITYKNCDIHLPNGFYRYLNNRKGADPSEWPEDLRVRELPEVGRG